MKSHSDVIALWPSVPSMAKDLGCEPATARAWRRNGRIPINRYDDVLAAAIKRGFELTYIELVDGGRAVHVAVIDISKPATE